jgi:hypothetical protein
MPTVSNAARVTSKDGAVWRTCKRCGILAALPPDVDRCANCQPATTLVPAAQLRAEQGRAA